MIITVKTLQQKTFKIEIEESASVLDLKKAIEANQGEAFPAAGQKLIYSGKILNDSQPLSDYSIQESNFVVVMVSKIKPAPAPTPKPQETSSTSSSSTPSTSGATPQPSSSATAPTTTSAPSGTTGTESTDGGAGGGQTSSTASSSSEFDQALSTLVTGTDYERTVNDMVGMGFMRNDVVRALQASYNNPTRAMEYLCGERPMPTLEEEAEPQPRGSGAGGQQVPLTSSPPQAPPTQRPAGQSQQSTPPSAAPRPPQGGLSAGGGQSASNVLQGLSQLPQFQALRAAVQQNPGLLPSLLQEIGQHNPELLQLINQNQQEFVDLLNQPPQPIGSGQELPPGTVSIQVTQEEREAIDRLKALGFPEGEVIQAYLACDKNETLAANLLLSSADDPEPGHDPGSGQGHDTDSAQ
ncbi:PREDICTED: UV excision repair protein RAD23 homolog A-like [Amphimedon queenslandica]|uniref:UV excision repair protein RAD23 n=2 Tax=Amphimedon queenslandica TaxID=400682 RepID=A0A1X7V402_AMPQE|nr:PREDICTED: UV excision repair protein RAD23 homolog A-like [Amphimedon queenslandica]|eukprot:XP_003385903.1 PREDICTED: UV excision repair protein RAD23 homolog A-like [Amphimedon queenslandica]